VLGAFLRPLSRNGALWASSLMFATIHLSPLTIVHHTLLGLVAGYARLETRSLLLPVLIHAVYNVVVVLAGLVSAGSHPAD
jgi:membrane protease YdiL (CAAX protease family)